MYTQCLVLGSSAILGWQIQNYFAFDIPARYNQHAFPIEYPGHKKKNHFQRGFLQWSNQNIRTWPKETVKGTEKEKLHQQNLTATAKQTEVKMILRFIIWVTE